MNDWRYDYAINDTGDLPLIDLRVDVEFMVKLGKLMDEVNHGSVTGEEPREMNQRGAS